MADHLTVYQISATAFASTADSLPYSRGALGDATLSLSVLLRAAGETSAIVGSWR